MNEAKLKQRVATRANLLLTRMQQRFPALVADRTGEDLLWERHQLMQLPPPANGTSANGSCHLFATQDSWLALNLARPEDQELLGAWLECEQTPALHDLPTLCAQHGGNQLVARGRLMGLAVATLGPEREVDNWYSFRPMEVATAAKPAATTNQQQQVPLVVDLSSLWAGPLASRLLQGTGMHVIRIESQHRPDPLETTQPKFHAALNAGKQKRVFDFRSAADLDRLRALIQEADIVIEGSRPKALQRLGIDVNQIATSSNKLWLSITAYGREHPFGDRVGFGDDVAVAAGLYCGRVSAPEFFGDAIADPLAGLHAAYATLDHFSQGHTGLLDVSLYQTAAHTIAGSI